jgi:hypothetical protein
MSRPQGKLQAPGLRHPAHEVRSSCGFCEGNHGEPAGVYYDVNGRCNGHTCYGAVPA